MIPDYIAEDYAEMYLCKMYHCRPSELDEEDYHKLQRHLAIQSGIDSYQQSEIDIARQRGG